MSGQYVDRLSSSIVPSKSNPMHIVLFGLVNRRLNIIPQKEVVAVALNSLVGSCGQSSKQNDRLYINVRLTMK